MNTAQINTVPRIKPILLGTINPPMRRGHSRTHRSHAQGREPPPGRSAAVGPPCVGLQASKQMSTGKRLILADDSYLFLGQCFQVHHFKGSKYHSLWLASR